MKTYPPGQMNDRNVTQYRTRGPHGLITVFRNLNTPVPADFDPYRNQIRDCHCVRCRALQRANQEIGGCIGLYESDRDEAERFGLELLRSLREGTHTHVSFDDFAARAKDQAVANGTYGQRGYVKVPGSLQFRDGTGFGMTPGGVR